MWEQSALGNNRQQYSLSKNAKWKDDCRYTSCGYDILKKTFSHHFLLPSCPLDFGSLSGGGRKPTLIRGLNAPQGQTTFYSLLCYFAASEIYTALPLSQPECPRHSATDLMIRHRRWSSIFGLVFGLCSRCMNCPMIDNGICYNQSMTSTEVQSPLRFRSGMLFLPNPNPSGLSFMAPLLLFLLPETPKGWVFWAANA